MRHGDLLINCILDQSDDSRLPNELLSEFQNGYPVENLLRLILDENPEAIKVGVWIASELGVKSEPLLEDITNLLNHKKKYIRFFSIDCILTCATKKHGSAVAAVVLLLEDVESAIRWKTLQFLMRATTQQLQEALSYFEATNDAIHMKGIGLLLRCAGEMPAEIISFMNSEQPVLRRFGVAAAARMVDRTDGPLQFALTVRDKDIAEFAKDVLQVKRK